MGNKANKTTVTSGGGYQSNKSTEIYTPDNAPINYQNEDSKNLKVTETDIHTPPSYTVLEDTEPVKELNISEDFLNSISQVYISGQYVMKGYKALRVKEIIALIVQNTGGYHIVVTSPSLKTVLIDIIKYGTSSMLGRNVSEYERNVIISIFKYDNRL
jgi:formylmethanofuran dehydrogenase subunit D